jgi:hypothetical protein
MLPSVPDGALNELVNSENGFAKTAMADGDSPPMAVKGRVQKALQRPRLIRNDYSLGDCHSITSFFIPSPGAPICSGNTLPTNVRNATGFSLACFSR